MIRKLARLWYTLRWLRPVQLYGRLWFRSYRPRPDLRAAPAARRATGRWQGCARVASMTGPATFRFLGTERTVASAADWNRADWPRLWSYNAHYFDDLAADGADARRDWHRALVARWIAENPPGQGTGWEPYPTSLRIVNWVKWALREEPLDRGAQQSLAVQARFLRRRLEFHLLGNHLWANAKALAFAGAYFEGPEADAWRAHGLALLRRELAEQVLPDGGHFERSPMYHAIVLEDVLDLSTLAQRYPGLFAEADVAAWRGAATRMLRWLRVMSHPDGGIALFNDAAMGVAPESAALHAYAGDIGMDVDETPLGAIEALPDSGYVRLQAGPAVLIADIGEIGPDYLPGHAHADTLSFELSLHGKRVLVNGGTSTYTAGDERLRQRGTAMHNTVVVDDRDSSEVWSSFRVARRARALDLRWGTDAGALWLEAGHDGYQRLPGRVTHCRRWSLDASGLAVEDVLEGRFDDAVARFRFAPGWVPGTTGQATGMATGDGVRLDWRVQGSRGTAIAAGTWHPRFGASEGCQVMSVACGPTGTRTEFEWATA